METGNSTFADNFSADVHTSFARSGWNVQYTFSGHLILVYGTVLPWLSGDTPAAQYTIDGNAQATTVAPNVSTPLGKFLFPYILDYFEVRPVRDPEHSTSISSMTTDTTGTSTSSDSVTTTTSPSSGPSASSTTALSSESSSSFPVAPVVGGVAGGIVLFVGLSALLYYCCKRSSKRAISERVERQDRCSMSPKTLPRKQRNPNPMRTQRLWRQTYPTQYQ
ncbi:hypothetical protein BD413DRAFT_315780 [Trametes elegans]|nr:hypothetical protein BD413DRAFT_315780 [Trametes elegans]